MEPLVLFSQALGVPHYVTLFLQSLPVTLYDQTSGLSFSLCLKCHLPVS